MFGLVLFVCLFFVLFCLFVCFVLSVCLFFVLFCLFVAVALGAGNSYSLARSPLPLPESAEIYGCIYIYMCVCVYVHI